MRKVNKKMFHHRNNKNHFNKSQKPETPETPETPEKPEILYLTHFMDVGMVFDLNKKKVFNNQQNFSYFAHDDFFDLKQKCIFTDLNLDAKSFLPTPKKKDVIVFFTENIVNNLDKFINSSFFDFSDQTLFQSIE